MFEGLESWKQFGIAGSAIIPFLLYKVWQLWKDDKKGSTIDARIDAYSNNLQIQLDKMGQKFDELLKTRDLLVMSNADFSAQLKVAQAQLGILTDAASRHVERIKYLEGLLKDKGISYVA